MRIAPVLIGFLAGFALFWAVWQLGPRDRHGTGSPAPEFSMTGLDGRTHDNASLRGKVAVINFWASWCAPCRAASKVMQELHREYAGEGLVVIGANTAEGAFAGDEDAARSHSVRTARMYAESRGFTYAFTAFNDELHRRWGFDGVPTVVVLDRQGIVTYVSEGWGDDVEGELRAAIERSLRRG
jgi:thiol-disulfide isomerase/thioredoxin